MYIYRFIVYKLPRKSAKTERVPINIEGVHRDHITPPLHSCWSFFLSLLYPIGRKEFFERYWQRRAFAVVARTIEQDSSCKCISVSDNSSTSRYDCTCLAPRVRSLIAKYMYGLNLEQLLYDTPSESIHVWMKDKKNRDMNSASSDTYECKNKDINSNSDDKNDYKSKRGVIANTQVPRWSKVSSFELEKESTDGTRAALMCHNGKSSVTTYIFVICCHINIYYMHRWFIVIFQSSSVFCILSLFLK